MQPTYGKTLDRKDNAKGYDKDNCRWATPTQQTRNRSVVRLLTFNGETKPAAEWAEQIGIAYGTLMTRIDIHGWSVEAALTRPSQRAA